MSVNFDHDEFEIMDIGLVCSNFYCKKHHSTNPGQNLENIAVYLPLEPEECLSNLKINIEIGGQFQLMDMITTIENYVVIK
jgi:hypothetical protein